MKNRLVYLILTILMFGCSPSSTQVVSGATVTPPDIGVSITQNGEVIVLLAPDGWNSFKIGESVYLMVQNISDEKIVSEHDLGVEMYLFQENRWDSVENNVVYPDANKIILEPNETFDILEVYTLFLLPVIPDSSEAVTLRIYADGSVKF